MNPSIFRISLDIHDEGSQVSLAVKKGDTIRVIQATLTERGKPYAITAGCTAVFTAKKPDGSILYNACTVSGSGITYAMTPQTTAAAGRADCEFRLYDAADELITSPRFNIIICDTVYDDDDVIDSTSEASALDALIDEATQLIETVEDKLANGEFDGADGQAATIEVGETATGEPGTPAAVVNAGTTNAAVLRFTIPKGEKGDTGPRGEKGDTGEKGNTGEKGDAATVAIGTVTTGAAGSGATVKNSGTSHAAVLDFVIPRGDKGETGAIGPAGPQGPIGPTGPKGDTGSQGVQGIPGTAATVSVGTVVTGEPGESAAVINTGTANAAVLDFVIPKGVKGDTGNIGPQGPKGDTGEGLTIKGRYDTLEALESAVPSPAAGDNYYVGTAAPYAVYTFTETDGWLNGGPLQGAKGDTGPAGPQGAAGPQGEPGPNELSGSTATAFAGLLKGNGTKVTTAVAGADYATPAQLEGKLDKTGGTLLGMLNAAGGLSIGVTDSLLKTTPGGVVNNAIADTDYATPGYVNGQISAHDSASGAHADLFDAKLDKTGGTINGALTVSGTLTVSTGTLYANSGIGLPTKSAIIKTTAGGLTTGATAGTDYEQVTIGGTTDRGYAKFASGLLVCWGNQGFGTQSITTAWGNLYEGPEYCIFSDFAYAFSAAPAVTAIQNYRSNSAFFVEGIYSTTATSPGKFIPVRPSPASVIVAASYIAIGRWK